MVTGYENNAFGQSTSPRIINLYCVSRDFRTITNLYLQSSTRQWAEFTAPGVADIFMYQLYLQLCLVDPAGRQDEDAAPDSLTSGFVDHGLDHSEIHSPTFWPRIRRTTRQGL
ncbi:hypothetical protein DL770_005570 [Monosporascus sp. CRB-9-2]|nr:hypothetical protein DL770_005570 [Monosporascus sp. CRB-9-2]